MDAMAEYLIKSEDFSKILATLLKEKVVDKMTGSLTSLMDHEDEK